MRWATWSAARRSPWGELAAYVAVTAAATLWLERGLLRELASYLHGAPAPESVPTPAGPAAAASR